MNSVVVDHELGMEETGERMMLDDLVWTEHYKICDPL